ncbi:MAG: hypothetical protein P4L84_11065 [Isosphaeraceae bacterium]|nr:hypothetical protein [Isosphaeraceae bacterium]
MLGPFGTGVWSTSGPWGASGMPAIGVPVPDADPTQEWIASGPGRYTPTIPQILPEAIDRVTNRYGFAAYDLMLATDPVAWSSYLAVKLGILNGPIKILPAVRDSRYRYRDPATRLAEGNDPAKDAKVVDPNAKLNPKQKLALEVAEFCERDIKRLRRPLKWTLFQLLDCIKNGNILAEKTRQYLETGADAGKLGLAKVKCKPYWAWRYVVDCWMDPTGILTYVPPLRSVAAIPDNQAQAAIGGFLILPMEKFVRMEWLPKDSDPRGTSGLEVAYEAYNLKKQLYPQFYRHGVRFGSPSVDMELAPGDITQSYPVDPRTGLSRTDLPKISATQRALEALEGFQNGSRMARPNGSKLNLFESKSKGEFFFSAFDYLDRQMALGIGLQVRATLESKFGSRADSETAENTRSLAIDYGREVASDMGSREILYDSIKLNYGEEIAEELCPILAVGDTEQHDRSDMVKAMASVGYKLGPSQFEEVDVMLGMPERDQDADLETMKTTLAMEAEHSGPDDEPTPKGATAVNPKESNRP